MSDTDSAFARNQVLAERLNAEVLGNPDHPFCGKWIGLANGQLVAVADDPEPLIEQLQQVEPDPLKCLCFEAGIEHAQEEYLWSPL